MKNILFIFFITLIASTGFAQTNYTFTGNGNWTLPSNWSNNTVPPAVLLKGSTIYISPESGDSCILDTVETISPGAGFVVSSGANFIIKGSLFRYNAADIFPDKVGDTWTYLVYDTTVRRSTKDSPSVQYNLTISVIDSIQLAGGIKVMVWVYAYPDRTDTNYVFQTGDTIHFIDNTQTDYPNYIRQYIIPLRLHNSWPYSTPSIYDVTVDQQSDIIVNGNNFPNAFNIYGYSGMPDATYTIDEWIVNNVGIVKRHYDPIYLLIDPRHVIEWTLLSYHLE